MKKLRHYLTVPNKNIDYEIQKLVCTNLTTPAKPWLCNHRLVYIRHQFSDFMGVTGCVMSMMDHLSMCLGNKCLLLLATIIFQLNKNTPFKFRPT